MCNFGVLFDVGYGLCDEGPRRAGAIVWLCQAMHEHGIDVSPKQLETCYQQACMKPLASCGGLLAQSMMAAGARGKLAKQLRKQMPWDAVSLSPLPGMIESLQQLHDAGLRIGVLANQPASALEDLKRCGASDFCDDIWLSDAVGLSKPDPAFFTMAIDAWGLAVGNIAYVGDRPDNDIAPAKQLGLYTVRMRLGPHKQQPASNESEQADFDAATLSEAASHLVRWARGG